MSEELRVDYTKRYEEILEPLAERLLRYLEQCIGTMPRVDRITSRAKTPDSFIKKAIRADANGEPKYHNPVVEIQDTVGVRIIVFYSDDVERALEIVKKYLRPMEQKRVVPSSDWAFGYSGLHMILALPEDVILDGEDRAQLPEVFELQIKTLFQHAWSEANHDLGYKPVEELTSEQQRRLAFAAAQAWGADREFRDLQLELASSP